MEQRTAFAARAGHGISGATEIGAGAPARRAYWRYLTLFLVVSAVTGLFYRALDRGIGALGCHHARPDGRFIALCLAPSFGDFEHGAYYYGLEPDAIAQLRAADILVFGSSRAQFAVSTQALRGYFRDRNVRPYLFGFGYYEGGAFPLAIVRQQDLKPKAIVVFADPFFQNRTTGLIRATEWVHWHVLPELYEYGLKRLLLDTQGPVCRAWPSLCEPKAPTVDRDAVDGAWTPIGFPLSDVQPIGRAAIVLTEAMAARDRAFAETFLHATGVARDCVVLSAAPSPLVDADAYVAEMGRLLGVRVALPRLDGLQSFDGNHLAPESAERWSTAFLAEVGDQLAACAGRPR